MPAAPAPAPRPGRRRRPAALLAAGLALAPVGAGAAPIALRDLDLQGLELSAPLALAHDPARGELLYLQRPPASTGAELVALDDHGDVRAVVPLPAELATALAASLDPASGLLVVLAGDGSLVELGRGGDGLPDPERARPLGPAPAAAAAGALAADPATGQLLLLDAPRRRVLRLAPESGEGGAPAVVGRIELSGAGDAAGLLAFHPGLRHLFLLDPAGRRLVELTEFGEPVAEHDVSGFELRRPRAMVFAPSADRTDDPETLSLYVADAGPAGRADGGGRILEASLAEPVSASLAAVASESATLVRVTQGSSLDPPSPDSSGLAYNPTAKRLLMSDGEVEEYGYFGGANVWELELGGTQRGTGNTTAFSNEPTGVAFNPIDGHLFFSDDDADKISEARIGTGGALVLVRQMSTKPFGNADPEGIAYDSARARLYTVDGVNAEVYRIARGPDGVFDGDDETITQFDVAALGLGDPEGIEYSPASDTLFIVDQTSKKVLETTTGGVALRSIDIAFLSTKKAAGVAQAPGSNDPGALHLYIADRGSDGASPIDGKIFEIALGSSPPPPPPPSGGGLDLRVAAAADDAEESALGSVSLGSSDLELVRDADDQTVGLRFTGVAIPRGADVTAAWVQLTADETATETTTLTLRGQASGNAPVFATGAFDLSSRPTVAASVGWSPPAWNTVGEAGAAQRTPDLSNVIEQIVARSDWTSGNALALLVTGSGRRVADSFEGGASLAPLLHVEFSAGVCGNGILEPGETCEGTNLGGASCADVGCAGGSPTCTASCTLSYAACSSCSVCGNGILEPGEACEGTNLGGASCASLGFYCSVGGGLACRTDCSYDTANCISGRCGDGVTQGVCGEACDGSDLGGETCVSQGFGSGTLRCRSDCSDLDLSQCSMCDLDGLCEVEEDCTNCASDCFGTGPACGNGVCETAAGEDCLSCPRDCRGVQSGKPSGRFCCGDGAGKNPIGCADPRCTSNGFACDPAPVPTSCCGNLTCEVPEDTANCGIDCS
jgi:DNA-binding beta-propeller fold protein YncE